MASLYTVSFVTPAGETVVSRYFSTVRAARKWAAYVKPMPKVA